MTDNDFQTLLPLIHGAATIQNTPEGIVACRFTPQQMKIYEATPNFWDKAWSTAGIRLEFRTDARQLAMDYMVKSATSRDFYYFDVVVNGVLVQHDGAQSCKEIPAGTLTIPLDGTLNHVSIWFPNLTQAIITGFHIAGASHLEPVHHNRTLICYGDSITHGYDAFFSSIAYPNQLAEAFDADILNKAIGGEYFHAELGASPDPVKPDAITIAYGTNDWSGQPKEVFQTNACGFLDGLVTAYPTVPVYLLLPIWRSDYQRVTQVGTFAEATEFIRNQGKAHSQVHVIEGLPLTPHVEDFYSDRYLHPNDLGFQVMGRNLISQIHFSDCD